MFDDMFPSPSLQSQHQLLPLHPHLLPVPPPDRNPMMPCSTLVRRVKKAFMASVASGQQEVLPPIPPAPPQQQQSAELGATCSSSSSSSLPAVVQGDPALLQLLLGEGVSSFFQNQGAPRPRGRKNMAGLDHAHPLEPLPQKAAPGGVANGSSVSMVPYPPVFTKATAVNQKKAKKIKARLCVKALQDAGLKNKDNKNNSGQNPYECMLESVNILKERISQEALSVAEEIRPTSLRGNSALKRSVSICTGSSAGSHSPVDIRTPSERQTLPLLRTPPFPTAPAVPTPPQTINCGQFRSRLPRLKKTASLSIAAAVEGE